MIIKKWSGNTNRREFYHDLSYGAGIVTSLPGNSSHPDTDRCFEAASFGFSLPILSLFVSSDCCKDLCCSCLQHLSLRCDHWAYERHRNIYTRHFRETCGTRKLDGTHPKPLFCILWLSILRCCGWRWVVLCRMGAWPRGGPWGPILRPDCPKNGLKLPTPPCNNGGARPRGNWPTGRA